MSRDTDDVTNDVDDVTNDIKGMVSNSGCSCARAMNFSSFSSYLGQELKVIPTIANCVTFMTFMSDLETEGHVMVCVTFVISACIRPTAMIFKFFDSSGFQFKKFILTLANCVIFTCDLEELKVTA